MTYGYWIEILGCIAGILTSFAFFPQIIKLLKTKQSMGISLPAYCCTFLGCALWFSYGIMIQSLALILFNTVNVITSAYIVFLTYKYRT